MWFVYLALVASLSLVSHLFSPIQPPRRVGSSRRVEYNPISIFRRAFILFSSDFQLEGGYYRTFLCMLLRFLRLLSILFLRVRISPLRSLRSRSEYSLYFIIYSLCSL